MPLREMRSAPGAPRPLPRSRRYRGLNPQFRLDGIPQDLDDIGLFNIGPGSQALGFFHTIRFGVPAGDDGFLAGVPFDDLAEGFQPVHAVPHEHIENDQIHVVVLQKLQGGLAAFHSLFF